MMDFNGVVAMDDASNVFSHALASSSCEFNRQRSLLCGSAAQKHGRAVGDTDELDYRSIKMGRSGVFPDGEQMLSFSSSSAHKPASVMIGSEGNLSYYNPQHQSGHSSAHYLSNGGLYCGSSNMSMHGVLTSVRGPFTPSQWLELEHQALIYKYIVANCPIPANLLIPIRRSLSTAVFNPYSAGSFLKWGSFHLGYSGNADPEPGRCRRTDGKKWRCSRDAVADQKYCERHMNRGRHRSRKHVEGQNGQAAKAMPSITSSQSTIAGRSSTSISMAQQHNKNIHPNVTNSCNAEFERMSMNNKEANNNGKDLESLSILTSVNPKPTSALFPISKQHNPFESTSTAADFRLFSCDSSFHRPASSLSDNISFANDPKPNDRQSGAHPLRHFIDEWPKTQSELSNVTWTDVEEMHSDRTQLSISIPVASSDLSSSTCSPNHEKLTLSPLHMSLGITSEARQQKGSWIPISWEASMAGPLGEVLTSTTNTPKDQSTNCSTSSLNLLTDGWDSSSQPESSPTGVLQKFSFDSLSSSTRSSPRIENHRSNETTGSLCDDLLGSIHIGHTTIPSL